MTHGIYFDGQNAQIYRREGAVAMAPEHVALGGVPAAAQSHWMILVAALGGLLANGESVGSVIIEPAPMAAVDWLVTDDEITGPARRPTAWRATLNIAVTIMGPAATYQRTVALNTEQFTSTEARDALLALWAHFAA